MEKKSWKKDEIPNKAIDALNYNPTNIEEDESGTDSGWGEEEEMALEEFRDCVRLQPHFVNCRIDDNFLLRFIRMRKLNVPQALQVLDKYLTVRTHYPFTYQNLDVEIPGILDLISKGYMFVLPQRDTQGRVVIFGISGVLDLTQGCQKREDAFRTFVMTFEALLEDEENQKKGITYVFDQGGMNLGQIYQLGLRDIQRLLSSGEKAMPIRHKMIHWLYLPGYLKAIYDVFKTFLSPKLHERLKVYDEIESLPTEIPRSILPKEYGGEVPLSEMTAQWIEILREKRKRLLDLDIMSVDEKKRPKVKTSRFGFMNFVNNLVGYESPDVP